MANTRNVIPFAGAEKTRSMPAEPIGILDTEIIPIPRKLYPTRYRFNELVEKDQSIWIPGGTIDVVACAVWQYATPRGLKFCCRTMQDSNGNYGVRVWRK